MTYSETLQWMYQQLPMYQREGKSALKKDLTNSIALDAYLKNPHNFFKTIHIAGTNGKGSVTHMISSVLQENRYKVGMYTSPHLKDFRERIKINGKMCSKKFVVDFIANHQDFLRQQQLSFFEMTVGMAFQYFKEQAVDFAVIETGLGGRLDSTNIISPIASVITNVDLDHTDILGCTIEQIAGEKAGIIKENTPVILGVSQPKYHDSITDVITTKAKNKNAPLHLVSSSEINIKNNLKINLPLKGDCQTYNLATVLKTFEVLQKKISISEKTLKQGLENTIKNTGLLGRWQTLSNNPLILTDTGHNTIAFQLIGTQLKALQKEKYHLVLGFSIGKDVTNMLTYLPENSVYYFTKPNVPRGLSPKTIYNEWNKKYNCFLFDNISDALNKAKKQVKTDEMIFIGGSTFTVAEVV